MLSFVLGTYKQKESKRNSGEPIMGSNSGEQLRLGAKYKRFHFFIGELILHLLEI